MEYEDVSIISWDTPNNHTGRAMMKDFAQADALIYVVDSADRERLPETREDLQELLEAEHLLLRKLESSLNASTFSH